MMSRGRLPMPDLHSQMEAYDRCMARLVQTIELLTRLLHLSPGLQLG